MQGSHENCPLCRHESNEFEKLPAGIYDENRNEDEDDDDDDDDEDDDWEEMPTNAELAAQERASGKFQRIKNTRSPEEMQLYAASLIKACWRGYQDRLLYDNLHSVKYAITRATKAIDRSKKNLLYAVAQKKFLLSTIGMSRIEVKNYAVRKIQKYWWSYIKVIRKQNYSIHQSSLGYPGLPGIWRKDNSGNWEKVIMNPEEDLP